MVKERITGGQGVPTQWAKLVDLPGLEGADLSSLRLVSTGSAPVSPELAEKMRARASAARSSCGTRAPSRRR